MSIRYPDSNNKDVIMYTDGVSFTESKKVFNMKVSVDKLESSRGATKIFYIDEGLWFFPFEFRLCIYTAEEILNNSFLDITNKITIYPNTFIRLEKEIEVQPFLKGMQTEYYYDVTFFNRESIVNLLQDDISLADKGNISCWKNSIELIDFIFK